MWRIEIVIFLPNRQMISTKILSSCWQIILLVVIWGLMYKKLFLLQVLPVFVVFFRIYYTLLIWVWRKLAGVLSMVFHTSTGCIRLTQISIFHHYFKCTEHCMNFNKQTLFLKGNLFSEGVPLLKSAVSQSRSGHVF